MSDLLLMIVALFAIALVVLLVWAYPPNRTRPATSPQVLFSENVKLPDGRVVACVFHGTSGGVSCDWSAK